jgi:transposase
MRWRQVSPGFRPVCHHYYASTSEVLAREILNTFHEFKIYLNLLLTHSINMYLIRVTHMTKNPPPDTKTLALRAARALHPCPDAVRDETFLGHEFFDRRDRVQVKYEMLRRHRVEGKPVTEVAAAFGVSRQAFYTAGSAFRAEGIPGLLPRQRGPRRAHKCTDEVLDFVEQWRESQPPGSGDSVTAAIRRRFGVSLHPRSIDRALARRKKKRQTRRETQE